MEGSVAQHLHPVLRPGPLSSVGSALHLLKAFSAEEPEIGISALARRLGLAKSTVHRLAATLLAEGFLEQNPETSRYRLGLALFALGSLARQRLGLSSAARPVLRALRDRLHGTVTLSVLYGPSALVLHHVEGDAGAGAHAHVGALRPAWCTAEGRALLAFATAPERAAALRGPHLPPTPRARVGADALRQALDDVRLAGYAIDDGESEPGLRCLAAPVRDAGGHTVAALALAVPVQRLALKDLAALAPEVLAAAQTLTQRLGGRVK